MSVVSKVETFGTAARVKQYVSASEGQENGWADVRLLLYRTSAECSEPWRAGGARYDISFFGAAAFRQCVLVADKSSGDRKNVQLRAVTCSQIQLYSLRLVLYCMM